jgi:hypothetical protein
MTRLQPTTKCGFAAIVEGFELIVMRLIIMKNIRQALLASLVASALVVPAAAFAQQSTITRAQVRGELAQLRAAGYQGDTEASYPVEIQAAEARVAAKRAQSGTSGYGSGTAGTSAAGAGATTAPQPGNSGQ